MIIPIKPINITEEVNKTLIWKQVNENTKMENGKVLSPKSARKRYLNATIFAVQLPM